MEVGSKSSRLVLAPPLDADEVVRIPAEDVPAQCSASDLGRSSWLHATRQPKRVHERRIAQAPATEVVYGISACLKQLLRQGILEDQHVVEGELGPNRKSFGNVVQLHRPRTHSLPNNPHRDGGPDVQSSNRARQVLLHVSSERASILAELPPWIVAIGLEVCRHSLIHLPLSAQRHAQQQPRPGVARPGPQSPACPGDGGLRLVA
mmetsp:Transcript_86176/g.278450  ORF Transcript_86176/g.278450 Transcript_86176/m.278450 type:complete len:206 (+) Transcript_86176:586-1203(+)